MNMDEACIRKHIEQQANSRVCGGDLNSNRRPYFNVSFFANHHSADCHCSTSLLDTPSNVK